MKARKNPTSKQILRRLRRRPESGHDPRYENDGYWALRLQGFPHSYARRAFRDEPPNVMEQKVTGVTGCDAEDILFPVGTTFRKVEVSVRPKLTEEIISTLQPRLSEYTVWDDKISGFGLRVRTSGRKSFVLLYRVRGETKLKKVTIGRAESIALAVARDMARELLSEARMGRDLAKRFRVAASSIQGLDD